MNEAAFAQAVLNPDRPLPAGVTDPEGRPAPRRFAVYRNNVVGSLVAALEAGFPVVRKLVGEPFFAAMARRFVRAHPPRSRLLMLYGDEFAGFLAGFAPVARLGYLPDVARLEQAIRESYHAADGVVMAPKALAALPEADLAGARLQLVPAVRLIRSRWPVWSIWAANMQGAAPAVMRAEDVLVTRVDFDPAPVLLPAGGGAFIAACLDRKTFAECLADAGDNFDLTAVLGVLVAGQAIEGLTG